MKKLLLSLPPSKQKQHCFLHLQESKRKEDAIQSMIADLLPIDPEAAQIKRMELVEQQLETQSWQKQFNALNA